MNIEVSEALKRLRAKEDREIASRAETPSNTQVGGDHYKKHPIQPVEYITKNGIPYIEGNIIKYVTRWRDKGGITDLEKARHYLNMLIEFESRKG